MIISAMRYGRCAQAKAAPGLFGLRIAGCGKKRQILGLRPHACTERKTVIICVGRPMNDQS